MTDPSCKRCEALDAWLIACDLFVDSAATANTSAAYDAAGRAYSAAVEAGHHTCRRGA